MKKILVTLAAALVVALGLSAPAVAVQDGPWVKCVRAPCP